MNVLLCVELDAILDELLVAFRWGIRLRPVDRVVVVHVLPRLPLLQAVGRVDSTVAEQIAGLTKRGDELLSRTVAFLDQEGLQARPLLREGNPAAEILQAAREENAELIVLGALGHEDRENFLLGSVSQKVKRHTDRDVFIVRGKGPSPEARYTAILAVDGSAESMAAVRSFRDKMQAVRADIHLLHVEEDFTRPTDAILEAARVSLQEDGLSCTFEVRRGRPASEILSCARELDARLIAVGARGLGAASGAFMGSVSARVLRHAPCAVLCGHSGEPGGGRCESPPYAP
jgi:nucleotide-binding universal stress UspA family protein